MQKQKNYRIYAIIAEDKVCVGKTTAQRIEPILWRHQRGEIASTRSHFARGLCKPRIVVLEEIQADVHMAYRHVIAFIRIFSDEQYKILNTPGMIEDAMDIHPLTQTILDDLNRIPLPLRLSQELDLAVTLPPETSATGNSASRRHTQPKHEQTTAKLTIHLTPSERERFISFAKDTGITQRQCLMLMLENAQNDDLLNPDWSANEYVSLMLRVYKEEIAKLEAQVQALQENLKAQNAEYCEKRKKRDAAHQQSLREYFSFYTSEHRDNDRLDQGLYADYLAATPPEQRHKYPTTENTFVFHPDAIFLGKGRSAPLFIIGRDSYHQRILLRSYPKQHRIGLRFTNETFGRQHAQWLVRCQRAKDGAMDLVFALPLDIVPKCSNSESSIATAELEAEADNLEDLIQRATRRSSSQY